MRAFLVLGLLAMVTFSSLHSQAKKSCAQSFHTFRDYNLDRLFLEYRNKPLEQLRADSGYRWIQLSNDNWVPYQIFGRRSGYLREHLEGLGGGIHSAMDNKIVAHHAKKVGRVLVIELEGYGLRELHRRIELFNLHLDGTRDIEHISNRRNYIEASQKIRELEGLPEPKIRSGHSFGGQTMATLGETIQGDKPLMQLFNPGVTNYSNRLLGQSARISGNFFKAFSTAFMPATGTLQINEGVRRINDNKIEAPFKNDTIQKENLVALTMGANSVDTVKNVGEIPADTAVQIFSAANEKVVLNMMHMELALAAREQGLRTTLVMVEGVGHEMARELSPSQSMMINRMSKAPRRYEGFYLLTRRGRLKPLTYDQALLRYQSSTETTWNLLEPEIRELFSDLGQTPRYPAEWEPVE